MGLVIPAAAAVAEQAADRLEQDRGPNRPATLLRKGSRIGRYYRRAR